MTQPLPLLRAPRRRRDLADAADRGPALDLSIDERHGLTPLWVDALMLGLVLASAYGEIRAAGGWSRIDFDRQRFPVAFTDHVDDPIPSRAVQRIAHEIHRKHVVQLPQRAERHLHARGNALRGPTDVIQPPRTVQAIDAFVIPRTS